MPPKEEGKIFKATYSGVPVYECIIKGVAVMRRRSDDWLNATQILKVVGMDKPQRTRVLERDVQKGIHEKVQGGYGKYQGTWIPMDVARLMSDQYNIQSLMDPILSYVASGDSPPPAPKHEANKRAPKRPEPKKRVSITPDSEIAPNAHANGSEGSMSPSPSDVSSSSRTPSPIVESGGNGGMHHRQDFIDDSAAARYGDLYRKDGNHDNQERYAEIVLDYFISESTTVPRILLEPPSDLDANMSLDDEEHAPLHWACAMGRIRVVKLLLSAGADVFRVNSSGQTALMRAVMYSNNYDLRKYPELFELLHRSILNIDRNDRTVFHHVVNLVLLRGKPHAARYYMETMITRLAEYGSQLADILNFQDDEGETPLTMAARARSKRLVRLLLEHGADPKIRNKDGKNAEDYIVEDERFRASPPRNLAIDGSGAAAGANYLTEAAQRASSRAVSLTTSLLHSLADSYDAEINAVDKRLQQAHSLLAQIQTEIAESGRQHQQLRREADAGNAEGERKKVAQLETALKGGVLKRNRDEVEKEWQEVEASAKRLRAEKGLSDNGLLHGSDPNVLDGSAAALLAPLPLGTTTEAAISNLRKQVTELKSRRSKLLDEFVAHAREQGTGKTMSSYRRLIAAGCGGIASEEVDAVVGVLCDLLDDPNTNVTADDASRLLQSAASAQAVRNTA